MTRGRKPEPAEIKLAKGNPGRRRIATAPVVPGSGAVVPPRKIPAKAQAVWKSLAPELERLKFLRPTDAQAFTRYCMHLAKWWELTDALNKEGETYESESNHGKLLRINPKFTVRDRLESSLERLEDRFGLTPVARQQLLQKLMMVPASPGDLFQAPSQASAETGANDTAPQSPLGILMTSGPVH